MSPAFKFKKPYSWPNLNPRKTRSNLGYLFDTVLVTRRKYFSYTFDFFFLEIKKKSYTFDLLYHQDEKIKLFQSLCFRHSLHETSYIKLESHHSSSAIIHIVSSIAYEIFITLTYYSCHDQSDLPLSYGLFPCLRDNHRVSKMVLA